MSWHVLYLRPRSEKAVSRYCQKLGFSHYLPLRTETKIYQRRKVSVHKPVFPGYIFISFIAGQLTPILRSNHIITVMEAANERQLLRELVHVRKALRVDPSLTGCAALTDGRRVRITAGPFAGIEGKVSSLKSGAVVRLNIEMIGQAIALEIDRDYLVCMDPD